MAATHHRHGSRTLPQRPSAHADPTTPAGENGFFGRLLPRPRRPSPYGRRVGSSEKLSRPAQGSRAFRPAHLHLGCTEDFSRGFSGRSLASTAPVATGRTDNSPGGTFTRWPSRPRRSLRNLNSAHVRPPSVSHCQPKGVLGEIGSRGELPRSSAPSSRLRASCDTSRPRDGSHRPGRA